MGQSEFKRLESIKKNSSNKYLEKSVTKSTTVKTPVKGSEITVTVTVKMDDQDTSTTPRL